MGKTHLFLGVDEFMSKYKALRPGEDCLFVNRRFNESVEQFCDDVAKCRFVAADFDSTLTANENQWAVIQRMIEKRDPAAVQEIKHNSARYWSGEGRTPLDLARLLLVPVQHMFGWPRSVIRTIANELSRRAGAIEVLRSFDRENVAVISFGVYDTIFEWLKMHASPEEAAAWRIFAMRLAYETNGTDVIAGYDLLTAVTEDKHYRLGTFLVDRHGNYQETLVLGDSISDAQMMVACKGVIIISPSGDPTRHAGRLQALPEFVKRASAILVSDSFEAIAQMRRDRPTTPAEARAFGR
ncbi:MAG: hypothetical protein WC730_03140 [Patescibacteria group bacterium]|jgi:phosphoserine phosphatase